MIKVTQQALDCQMSRHVALPKIAIDATSVGSKFWRPQTISIKSAHHNERIARVMSQEFDIGREFAMNLVRRGKVSIYRAPYDKRIASSCADDSKMLTLGASKAQRIIPRCNIPMIAGDVLALTEFSLPTKKTLEVTGIKVLYADEQLVAINKPIDISLKDALYQTSQLLGISNHSETANTTSNSISSKSELTTTNQNLFPIWEMEEESTGIALFARSISEQKRLRDLIGANSVDGQIRIYYWAMVYGGRPRPRNRAKLIVSGLYPSKSMPSLMTTYASDAMGNLKSLSELSKETTNSKPTHATAITHYRWLQYHRHLNKSMPIIKRRLSLVELRPLTGHRHQIRAQLCEQLQMPIVGDYKYFDTQPLGQQLHLHLRKVEILNHLGKTLRIEAPIPSHWLQTMKSAPMRIDAPPKRAK